MTTPKGHAERVLLVEDDRAIAAGLSRNLEYEGFHVSVAHSAADARTEAARAAPDLLILDVMLPDGDGVEVLHDLRAGGLDVPVLMLTARDAEADKLKAFDHGADDYVTKPFSTPELMARVRALSRRLRRDAGDTVEFGDVTVDFAGAAVTRSDEPVEMSSREFRLLRYLLENRGAVVSREMILNRVWGIDYDGTPRTVDNFINRLRRKLEPDPGDPTLIRTVRGLGYKLVLPAEDRG